MARAYDVVAEIDETQTNEFGDVQYFDVIKAGKASTDAGEDRPDGNENVTEKTRPSFVVCEILDGRVHSAAKKETDGIEVEHRRKTAHPLPDEHSPREAFTA